MTDSTASLTDKCEYLEQRVKELIQSSNAEVERRRKADRLCKELAVEVTALRRLLYDLTEEVLRLQDEAKVLEAMTLKIKEFADDQVSLGASGSTD
jgi:hypothetical protein